jgi:hypothetical protein
MATGQDQRNVFKQGKMIDPRDVGLNDFLNGKQVDNLAGVFVEGKQVDPKEEVFLASPFNGGIKLHDSAKDFLGE